jgi:hypothetical protein
MKKLLQENSTPVTAKNIFIFSAQNFLLRSSCGIKNQFVMVSVVSFSSDSILNCKIHPHTALVHSVV